MLLSKVLGVIVIARNGDRYSLYQDPFTYSGSNTETTALGEVGAIHLIHNVCRLNIEQGRIVLPW